MPNLENGEARLHYEVSGCATGELLLLSNSLGSNLHMWDKVLPDFNDRLKVLRYDTRGHGQSSIPREPCTVQQLGCDVLLLLDHLAIERVSFCGLSLGGIVGMWMGIHAPERVSRLVLANTAARIGTTEMWEQRLATVEDAGMASLADATLTRWFTPTYREGHTDEMAKIREMIAATDPCGYSACCAALRDADLRNEVEAIVCPCLVVTGRYDPATPPADGAAVNARLRNSRYVELEASHLSAWERAEDFAQAVLGFLDAGEYCHG
jgi:3-oxoadipate enol-lactonase